MKDKLNEWINENISAIHNILDVIIIALVVSAVLVGMWVHHVGGVR